jgi:hypothetical protein
MNETISRGGRQAVGFGECPVVRPEGIYYGGRRVIRLGVGDIGCSGINLDEWKTKNRVRLYPGQRIRWIFARSTDDKASLDDIRAQVVGQNFTASVFQKWFDPVALLPGDFTETEAGKIDNLSVLGIGTREAMITAGQAAGLVIAQKAEDMPGPILVRLPKIYVLVEFVYRGTQNSMPWPMYDDATIARKWCPTEAQWGLSIAFKQGADAAVVPKETTLSNPSTYTPLPSSETIAKTADEIAKKAADLAGEIPKALNWALIAGVTVAVVAVGGAIIYYAPRRSTPNQTPAPEPNV